MCAIVVQKFKKKITWINWNNSLEVSLLHVRYLKSHVFYLFSLQCCLFWNLMSCGWEILGVKYMYLFLQKKHSSSQLMPWTFTVAYVLPDLFFYFRNHHIFYQQHSLLSPDFFHVVNIHLLVLKQNACVPCHILTYDAYG